MLKIIPVLGLFLWLGGAAVWSESRAVAADLDSQATFRHATHFVLWDEGDKVQIRLVDEISGVPQAGAAVSIFPGEAGGFMIDLKRSTASADILAASLKTLRPYLEKKREHPSTNVVIYVSETGTAGTLEKNERRRLEQALSKLKSMGRGSFLDLGST